MHGTRKAKQIKQIKQIKQTKHLKQARKSKQTKKGGEVLDSGGYGCVFYPALKCKNKKTRTDGISKLSLKKYTMEEWNIYKKINSLLKVIPNYKKYFLLDDFSICNPDSLTPQDKNNFEKCYALDYNSANINNNLDNFMIINMPYGGENLDTVITNNLISFKDMNILLRNLVINAIFPMNKLYIYHFDIKASNILYKNNNLTIIDFGMLDFKDKNNSVPKKLLSTSGIQYNSPFSKLLFNEFILTRLNYSLKNTITNKKDFTIPTIFKIFKNIYHEFIYNFSEGHEKYLGDYVLNKIYKIKNKKPKQIKTILIQLICNYCSHVILNYFDFDKGDFNKEKYFESIFSKNVDIYGILSCYLHYILSPHRNYSNNFKSNIIDIIYEYIFNSKYAVTVIPILQIIDKLNKIPIE
jgi:hypothetical protein